LACPYLSIIQKFHAPGLYDDELTVICHVDQLPTAKIEFSYRIKNADGDLINEGKTTLVFMNMLQKKVIKAPEWIVNALRPYFNS
jgi:acyl-CoA thioester hydrolase